MDTIIPEVILANLLLAALLHQQITKCMEKPPMLGKYDWKGDPNEHVQLVNEVLN